MKVSIKINEIENIGELLFEQDYFIVYDSEGKVILGEQNCFVKSITKYHVEISSSKKNIEKNYYFSILR